MGVWQFVASSCSASSKGCRVCPAVQEDRQPSNQAPKGCEPCARDFPAGEPRPGLPRVVRVEWGHHGHGRVIERL